MLVLLHYEQGLTLDEIGPVMGLSKAALSRRLKRIRDALLETTDALPRAEIKRLIRQAYDLVFAKLPKKTQAALAE